MNTRKTATEKKEVRHMWLIKIFSTRLFHSVKKKISGYLLKQIYADFIMATSKIEEGPSYIKRRIHFP